MIYLQKLYKGTWQILLSGVKGKRRDTGLTVESSLSSKEKAECWGGPRAAQGSCSQVSSRNTHLATRF